jgi:Fe-S cluster biosynthesis and repair protein YggX
MKSASMEEDFQFFPAQLRKKIFSAITKGLTEREGTGKMR